MIKRRPKKTKRIYFYYILWPDSRHHLRLICDSFAALKSKKYRLILAFRILIKILSNSKFKNFVRTQDFHENSNRKTALSFLYSYQDFASVSILWNTFANFLFFRRHNKDEVALIWRENVANWVSVNKTSKLVNLQFCAESEITTKEKVRHTSFSILLLGNFRAFFMTNFMGCFLSWRDADLAFLAESRSAIDYICLQENLPIFAKPA